MGRNLPSDFLTCVQSIVVGLGAHSKKKEDARELYTSKHYKQRQGKLILFFTIEKIESTK